jgi:hypothetical protein
VDIAQLAAPYQCGRDGCPSSFGLQAFNTDWHGRVERLGFDAWRLAARGRLRFRCLDRHRAFLGEERGGDCRFAGDYGSLDLCHYYCGSLGEKAPTDIITGSAGRHGQAEGVRFQLLTNWRIDRDDPLRELIHQRSHTLRLDRLFGTKTSGVRSARSAKSGVNTLASMKTRLGSSLARWRCPKQSSAFIYDQLVYQWMAQGRLEFDQCSLRDACRAEGLLADSRTAMPPVFGVKSFEHAHDRIEERCTAVLNLLPEFLERQIRPDADWQTTAVIELRAASGPASVWVSRLHPLPVQHLRVHAPATVPTAEIKALVVDAPFATGVRSTSTASRSRMLRLIRVHWVMTEMHEPECAHFTLFCSSFHRRNSRNKASCAA